MERLGGLAVSVAKGDFIAAIILQLLTKEPYSPGISIGDYSSKIKCWVTEL